MSEAFTDYVPPKKEKKAHYSVRLEEITHLQLVVWTQENGRSVGAPTRAEATRHALEEWLREQGMPTTREELIARMNKARYKQAI